MAVAVKNTPEVRTPSAFDRIPVVGLLGAVYVVGCLAILGKVLPYLWWETLGLAQTATNMVLLILVLAAAAVGLGYVGLQMLGRAPVGTRAAIFVAFLGILLILLLTRWASLWIEYEVYVQHMFGPSGQTIGPLLTAAVGFVLLCVGCYYFLDKRCEAYLVQFGEQGWFNANAYKPLQGQRVRRGTVFGILLIVGSGIYTLMSQGTLQRGPADWSINIPFTGRALITNDTKGDAGKMLAERFPTIWEADEKDPSKGRLKEPVWLSLYELRDINDQVNQKVRITFRGASVDLKEGAVVPEAEFKREVEDLKANGDTHLPTASPLTPASGDEVSHYVRIRSRGEAENPALVEGAVVPRTVLEAEINKLKGVTPNGAPDVNNPQTTIKKLPTAVPLTLSSGTEVYQSLTLLPALQYTLPLLLIAASMWLAWRMVNYPVFADFLIATEAELNKVSWTTRKGLIQDTIVVLITVFLLTAFLFAMDQAWSHLLSWKQIGVIQLNREPDKKAEIENRPW